MLEQLAQIVRPGTGLGMPLEAERRAVSARQALQGTVEQRAMRRAQRVGSVASSTAKPWFWLEISTRPESISVTGWLAP